MQKRQARQRKTPRIDLSPYRGEWVAIHPRTQVVVSHDPSCKEAERAAIAAGVKRPLLVPVPNSSAFFVGRANPSARLT
jgi:hypothetical protein